MASAAFTVLALLGAGAAVADTPGTALFVTPNTNLNPAGQAVQVSGTGFGANGSGTIQQCIQLDAFTEDCPLSIGTFTTGATGSFDPVMVTVVQNLATSNGLPATCSTDTPCSVYASMNANPQDDHAPITFASTDNDPPTCSYLRVNANPKRIDFTVRDTGSGLWKIEITTAVNIVSPVVFPLYTSGTTDPASFSAVKDDQSLGSRVAVVITDIAGNKASCV